MGGDNIIGDKIIGDKIIGDKIIGFIKKNRENQYLSVSKKNFIQSVRQVGIFQRFILQ